MAEFKKVLPTLDAIEGGYANDPDDPGGETKFGISKRSYPDLDIKNLEYEDAVAIYKRDFWDKLKLDEVENQTVAEAIFDMAVNSGPSNAVKMAQELVGAKVDGKIGPETLGKLNEADPAVLLDQYADSRLGYYEDLAKRKPKQRKHLKSWVARAERFRNLPEEAEAQPATTALPLQMLGESMGTDPGPAPQLPSIPTPASRVPQPAEAANLEQILAGLRSGPTPMAMNQELPQAAQGLPELSALGVTKPSASSSVGPDNPALSDFLKQVGALDSPMSRAAALEDLRDQLAAQEKPSWGEGFLKKGLLPTALGGIAALAGQPGLGAGLALGGLSAGQLVQKEAEAQRLKGLEQTQQQLDKTYDRIDKMHERMKAVYQANPESFLSPEGEMLLDPMTLGYLVSGVRGVQMYPQTRRILEHRTKQWDQRQDLFIKALEGATNPEDKRAAVRGLAQLSNWNMSPETEDLLVRSLGEPGAMDVWMQTMVKEADPATVRDATMAWVDAGQPDFASNPEAAKNFMRMLDFTPTGGSPEQRMKLQRLSEVSAWQADPANAELIDSLVEQGFAPGSPEFAREVAKLAFAGDDAKLQAFLSEYSTLRDAGFNTEEYTQIFMSVLSSQTLIDQLIQDPEQRKALGLDDASRMDKAIETTRSILERGSRINDEAAISMDLQVRPIVRKRAAAEGVTVSGGQEQWLIQTTIDAIKKRAAADPAYARRAIGIGGQVKASEMRRVLEEHTLPQYIEARKSRQQPE